MLWWWLDTVSFFRFFLSFDFIIESLILIMLMSYQWNVFIYLFFHSTVQSFAMLKAYPGRSTGSRKLKLRNSRSNIRKRLETCFSLFETLNSFWIDICSNQILVVRVFIIYYCKWFSFFSVYYRSSYLLCYVISIMHAYRWNPHVLLYWKACVLRFIRCWCWIFCSFILISFHSMVACFFCSSFAS